MRHVRTHTLFGPLNSMASLKYKVIRVFFFLLAPVTSGEEKLESHALTVPPPSESQHNNDAC